MSYRRISPTFRNWFRVGQKRKSLEGTFFEDNQGCSTQECREQWRISPASKNMHSDEINFPSGRRVNARRTPAWR